MAGIQLRNIMICTEASDAPIRSLSFHGQDDARCACHGKAMPQEEYEWQYSAMVGAYECDRLAMMAGYAWWPSSNNSQQPNLEGHEVPLALLLDSLGVLLLSSYVHINLGCPLQCLLPQPPLHLY